LIPLLSSSTWGEKYSLKNLSTPSIIG
jgi:hypothetical protein